MAVKPAADSEYSGTPLAKKLGLKSNFKIKIIHPPENYWELFSDLPSGLQEVNDSKTPKDFIQCFTTKAEELKPVLPKLKKQLVPNGALWISWPKKASRVPTDITEDTIRELALKNGLVDVKVCAVDEVWSALKLVIPVKDRRQ
jgi:hypothetical protein